ncbi:MAG: tetratricopeptide repeat protein [Candidatus Eremiobacteraeota bacterium]|nr:tetratricopeptide repeat protein [Candidatus Eremiobacteraeota bacterium]
MLSVAQVAADDFRDGNRELREGHPEAALSHYRQALKEQPQNPFLLYNAGMALQQLERRAEAHSHFERALAQAPLETATLILEHPGRTPFTMALATADLFRYRALTRLAEVSPPDQAIGLFQRAIELAPPAELDAQLGLARALAAAGRKQEAIHLYQFFLENAIEFTGIPNQLAVWGPDSLRAAGHEFSGLQLRVGRDGKVTSQEGIPLGIRLPETAYGLKVDSDGVMRVWKMLTGLQVPVGQLRLTGPSKLLVGYRLLHPLTHQAWQEMQALDPSLTAEVVKSPFLSEQERREQLESLAPGYYREVRLGTLLWSHPGLAEDHLRKAAELSDLQVNTFNLAAVVMAQGRLQEGLDLLSRLPSRRAYRFRLQAAFAAKDYPTALDLARQGMGGYPEDPYFQLAASECLAEADHPEAALEILDLILARHPTLFYPYADKVRLLGRQGRLKDQVALLDQMIAHGPAEGWAQAFLDSILERTGGRRP